MGPKVVASLLSSMTGLTPDQIQGMAQKFMTEWDAFNKRFERIEAELAAANKQLAILLAEKGKEENGKESDGGKIAAGTGSGKKAADNRATSG
jgi:hypothetical protein